MRLLVNIFALIGVLALISIGVMEKGFWPDGWWHSRIKRVITRVEMGPEVGSTNDVITAVCGRELNWRLPNWTKLNWSPRRRKNVVTDIRVEGIEYFVECVGERAGEPPADIIVFNRGDEWFIKTAHDTCINLSDLPKTCEGPEN